MDAITSYIDHMFRALPHTAEVRRARSELLQMSEDRYRELVAEGASENEAVGRVITQFGHLDEIADDLGIRSAVDGVDNAAIAVSAAEAERYVRASRRSSVLIGLGILAILIGLVVQRFFSEAAAVNSEWDGAIGTWLFFSFVALGVALFIIAGFMMSRFESLEERTVALDGQSLAFYRQVRESEETRHMALVVSGIVTILLGAAALAVGYQVEPGRGMLHLLRLAGPIVIGIGVFLLIRAGMRRSALDRLTSQGDYTPEARAASARVSRWSGPYWMLTLTVFLAWSFISGNWGITWIVWPIAAVTYGLVLSIANAITAGKAAPAQQ